MLIMSNSLIVYHSAHVRSDAKASATQCYFSSRNHFYSNFYSVHDEINQF